MRIPPGSIPSALPIRSGDESGQILGGLLALMNWESIQEILDKVEEDLEQHSLPSGYAFMWGRDVNTVIGHKYRSNRSYFNPEDASSRHNYGSRLIEDHKLFELQEAVAGGATHFSYEYPRGTPKISGMAAVNHEFFRWICGVGIDEEDIFAPVQDLKFILLWVRFCRYRSGRSAHLFHCAPNCGSAQGTDPKRLDRSRWRSQPTGRGLGRG